MKRIANPVDTDELCSYGCGSKARFMNGSGNLMCEDRHNKCPAIKKKNSTGVTSAHEEGRIPGWNGLRNDYGVDTVWNRGKRFAVFEYGGKGQHKLALIQERGHRCECCGLDVWLGKPITLELEHTDGVRKNNTRENLKLLCPNCHSQTDTWRRPKVIREDSKVAKHTDDDMANAITGSKTMNEALEKLDLRWGSAGTLANLMGKMNIQFMPT